MCAYPFKSSNNSLKAFKQRPLLGIQYKIIFLHIAQFPGSEVQLKSLYSNNILHNKTDKMK